MLNPKAMTLRLLATTSVREEYVELPAGTIWFALMQRYAPDVPIELFYPEQFRNPEVTSRFPGIPLRTALEDLCRFCGVEMTVSDYGSVQLRPPPPRVEAMKHAVVIEPDNRTWQKVAVQR